jgi:hypothetical protein
MTGRLRSAGERVERLWRVRATDRPGTMAPGATFQADKLPRISDFSAENRDWRSQLAKLRTGDDAPSLRS